MPAQRAGYPPQPPNHLVIYAYHALISSPLQVFDWCFLDVGAFRQQLVTIKRQFPLTVSLSEAVERLQDGTRHAPMAAITFDDGFCSVYDLAYPILRELGMPATVFPTAALIGTDSTLWFCRVNRALALNGKRTLHWDGRTFDLSSDRLKARASAEIQSRLKRYKHPRLLAEVDALVLELGDDPRAPIAIDSPYRMLSDEVISEMALSGLVDFGAHGYSHAILSPLTPGEQEDEILRSLHAVRTFTGQPCRLFAYPNGRRQDYNEETIRILHSHGVQAAVTTMSGFNDERKSLMELGRYEYSARRGAVLLPLQAWSARVRHAVQGRLA